METTFESSSESELLKSIRSRITFIEAIELAAIGFALWCFFLMASPNTQTLSLLELVLFLTLTEGILLGSWFLYNVYIRIARAGGKFVDISLWILATLLTSSYTFWAWSLLDLNRVLIAKFLYVGDAPVEFAWSVKSKQVRKIWERARKVNQ